VAIALRDDLFSLLRCDCALTETKLIDRLVIWCLVPPSNANMSTKHTWMSAQSEHVGMQSDRLHCCGHVHMSCMQHLTTELYIYAHTYLNHSRMPETTPGQCFSTSAMSCSLSARGSSEAIAITCRPIRYECRHTSLSYLEHARMTARCEKHAYLPVKFAVINHRQGAQCTDLFDVPLLVLR
jgi:hypothetical protein